MDIFKVRQFTPAALLKLFLILFCLAQGASPGLGNGGFEEISQVHKSTMIGTCVQLNLVQPFNALLYGGSSGNQSIKSSHSWH